MKKIWWNELIDTKRTTIIHAVFFCTILILFVLCSKVFHINAYEIYLGVSDWPASLKLPIAFLYKLEIPNAVRCLLLVQSALNFPVLFYAALLPAHIIGKENENGMLMYVCNGPFSRKDIFYGKLLACCTNYAVVTAAMFFTGAIMTVWGMDFVSSFLICARVYGMLLVMGMFLIYIFAFYCAVKNTYTHSRIRVFFCLLINMAGGYCYLLAMTVIDVLEARGTIVSLNQTFGFVLYILQQFSAVHLCGPGEIYLKFPWMLVAALFSFIIIIGTISGKIIEGKDFGRECTGTNAETINKD